MTPSREQLIAALESVNDPHVPVSLRRMGMLREVSCENGVARVQVCIPCMACPGASMLRDRIEAAVGALPGVAKVIVEEGWHLPWSPDMVEPAVKDLMRANGIQL
jgi:metal-sulfur cluster biosynthetic enzyme